MHVRAKGSSSMSCAWVRDCWREAFGIRVLKSFVSFLKSPEPFLSRTTRVPSYMNTASRKVDEYLGMYVPPDPSMHAQEGRCILGSGGTYMCPDPSMHAQEGRCILGSGGTYMCPDPSMHAQEGIDISGGRRGRQGGGATRETGGRGIEKKRSEERHRKKQKKPGGQDRCCPRNRSAPGGREYQK
jgi:hypothetical protein